MIKRLRYEGNLFLLALGFFSRIPLPRNLPYSPDMLNRSSRYYSAVGWLLGALVATVLWGAMQLLPVSVSIWIAMIFSLLLTGVFHEDGLADMADGFGGAFDRDKKLLIMKDSRIGSYGSAALIMGLLGKYVLLSELALLPGDTAINLMLAIVIAYTLSRAMAGSLIFDMAYVSDPDTSKSKPLANQQNGRDCAILVLLALPALLLLSWQTALAAALVTLAVRELLKRFFIKQIGGYTGDCLGGAQQISELAIYATLLAMATRA